MGERATVSEPAGICCVVLWTQWFDGQHIPMSLITEEDRCYRINGILFVVSSLSFCYHCLLLVLCVFSTVLSAFPCPLPRPHHFVIAGLVCHMCLSVRLTLCKFIAVERCILNRVASQQICARRKQSAAKERWSQHDGIIRQSAKATTNWFQSKWSRERRGRNRKQFGGNIGQPWTAFWDVLWTNDPFDCWVLWEETVGSKRMSREG